MPRLDWSGTKYPAQLECAHISPELFNNYQSNGTLSLHQVFTASYQRLTKIASQALHILFWYFWKPYKWRITEDQKQWLGL